MRGADGAGDTVHGGGIGAHLHNVAGEGVGGCGLEGGIGEVLPGGHLGELCLGVVRGRGLAEAHRAGIHLLGSHEALGGLGALADADDEEAGREGVERARVADLLHVQRPLELAADVLGCPGERLVYEEHAVVPDLAVLGRQRGRADDLGHGRWWLGFRAMWF